MRGQNQTPVGVWHGAALLGYALLTTLMTWPLAAQVMTAIPGDAFDGWQNYWNLWWVKLALVERLQNPYWTDLLYAPTGVGLYFHTLNPFNGLVTLPVQLSAGLIPAYNAVVWISWVLAGYGTYLLTRWSLGRMLPRQDARGHLAAFVAGAIFTFAPVHMAHLLGHMQVMALQWLPFYGLALLMGMRAAQAGRPWRRHGLLAGGFLTLAGLCDWYFVLYLLLFTGVVIVWQWGAAAWQRARAPRAWWGPVAPAALAGGVFALLLAPVLAPMVSEAVRFSFMVRPSSDLYILSASLADFVIPNRLHTLARPESFSWMGNQIAPVSERTIGIGYGALALAGVALLLGRGRRTWGAPAVGLWAVAAGFFVLMALGPRPQVGNITWDTIPAGALDGTVTQIEEWSVYALVNQLVPFMRISRSVSRFAILVQVAVAVLAGIGLALAAARLGRRAGVALAVGALGVVLAESWVAPYPMSPPDTPAFYATLAEQPGRGAVLNLPMNYDRPGYLLYQTVHQRPLTVAYISRDDPRTLTERVPLLQHWRHLGPDILADDPAAVGRTALADLGVEWVVLDRYKMPGGDERTVTEAIAAAVLGDSAPVYADERITVYQLTPPAARTPYLQLGPLHWGPRQEEGSRRWRMVGAEPAELTVVHGDAASQVMLRYRSTTAAQVRGEAGQRWELPAAPTGGTVTVAGRAFVLESPHGPLAVEEARLLP